MKLKVIVGTRPSQLAKIQTTQVCRLLSEKYPKITLVQREIVTTGDRDVDRAYQSMQAKSLFTKEIDEALLAGEIDCAVHSLKDVPSTLPAGLSLVSVCAPADVRDVFISKRYAKLLDVPANGVIGTASARRQALLAVHYPRLQPRLLRGNVDTRLRKVDGEDYDGIILAAAGLERMGLAHRINEYLDPEIFVPAVGQGLVGVVARSEQNAVYRCLLSLSEQSQQKIVLAQRLFLNTMQGGCRVPLGCYVKRDGDTLLLIGFLSDLKGVVVVRCQRLSTLATIEVDARQMAVDMLSDGGDNILQDLRNSHSADDLES